MKVLLIAAIYLAACNEEDHPATDRPPTLAYVTETILAPTCGTAECHSTFHAQSGDVYDTVEGAQATLANPDFGLVYTCAHLTPPQPSNCYPMDVDASYLITVISSATREGDRMPLDQVMSRSDQEVLGLWIEGGAEGLVLGDDVHQ